jgi:sulfur dioxygenase
MKTFQNPLQLFDTASSTFSYILADATTGDAIIIDPVDVHLTRDLALLSEYGLTLRYVLETHAHADHITSAAALVEHTGAQAATPVDCAILPSVIQLENEQILQFGKEAIQAIHTPGHTAGSMCFLWGDCVFTGDTLLINGCGRTDFQSGDAGLLYDSITQKLFQLPAQTRVWPGHDYNGRLSSTIGAEKAGNSRITQEQKIISRPEFIARMDALNLPQPKRLGEAVPANQHLGLRQDAAPDQQNSLNFAGHISPQDAYALVVRGHAVLVDIRSDAERTWVGFVPNSIDIEWKIWPGMEINPHFDAQLKSAVTADKPLLMLCRSGIRSIAAAQRAQALGYQAWNILEGFEGDPDDAAHRGNTGGWRHRGLPWRQN